MSEDGGSTFIRNIDKVLSNCTAAYLKRQFYSQKIIFSGILLCYEGTEIVCVIRMLITRFLYIKTERLLRYLSESLL
jgi:hypothetical protein